MTQELNTASDLLCTAIDRYLDACCTFRDFYTHEIVLNASLVGIVDIADNELRDVAAYHIKLKQSISAISLVRNTASTAVPINVLPPEILARIFKHVLDASNPPLHAPIKLLPQDVLSHVCTRWRRVATNSRTFWSQIDLGLQTSRFDSHLERAGTYAARANPAPLNVRISLIDQALQAETSAQTRLRELVHSIAPRVRSVQFHVCGELAGLCRLLMESCLAAGTPGTLSTLMINISEETNGDRPHQFIESVESPSTDESLLLNVSQEHLEALLLRVRVLWISGIHPYWTSSAYHGLTELRLEWMIIMESQLVDILIASPGLQTLTIRCDISNPRSQDTMTPVRLTELENLSLHLAGGNDERDSALEILLRHLAPGSKPFGLTITGGSNLDHRMLNSSVKQFLSRTNTTKMSLEGAGSYLALSEVSRLSPNLREASLKGFDISRNHIPAHVHKTITWDASRPGLASLSLIDCRISLEDFRQMIQDIRVNSLEVWDCFAASGNQLISISEETLATILSDVCTVTRATEPKGYYEESLEWEQWP